MSMDTDGPVRMDNEELLATLSRVEQGEPLDPEVMEFFVRTVRYMEAQINYQAAHILRTREEIVAVGLSDALDERRERQMIEARLDEIRAYAAELDREAKSNIITGRESGTLNRIAEELRTLLDKVG